MFLFKKRVKSNFYREIESLISEANPDNEQNKLKIIHKRFVDKKN
jgi:hypothetical protein